MTQLYELLAACATLLVLAVFLFGLLCFFFLFGSRH